MNSSMMSTNTQDSVMSVDNDNICDFSYFSENDCLESRNRLLTFQSTLTQDSINQPLSSTMNSGEIGRRLSLWNKSSEPIHSDENSGIAS